MDAQTFTKEIAATLKDFLIAEIDPLRAEIAALSKRFDELPTPADGKDGAEGPAGKNADPVSDEQIEEAVKVYLTENPPAPGKDGEAGPQGEKGDPGERGEPGEKGDPGETGPAGRDGLDVADLFADEDGCLVATFADGRTKNLGKFRGKDGEPGKDGRDGITLEGFDATAKDGGRTMELSYEDKTCKFVVEVDVPVPLYRGPFKPGQTYKQGDLITWGGCIYHCDAATEENPRDASDNWTLAVKRGRDGKDGILKPPLPSGPVKIVKPKKDD